MNETTQYLITTAVIDLARSMAATANLKLPPDAPAEAHQSIDDFIPQALDGFLFLHSRVQSLLTTHSPA